MSPEPEARVAGALPVVRARRLTVNGDEVEVLEAGRLEYVDEGGRVVVVRLAGQQQRVSAHVRVEVRVVAPSRRAGVRVHDATFVKGGIAPHAVEEALAHADRVADRVLGLIRIASQAVEEPHLRVHHRVLAARAEGADEVLKLDLVLEVVARDAARARIVVLAKFQVPGLRAPRAESSRGNRGWIRVKWPPASESVPPTRQARARIRGQTGERRRQRSAPSAVDGWSGCSCPSTARQLAARVQSSTKRRSLAIDF